MASVYFFLKNSTGINVPKTTAPIKPPRTFAQISGEINPPRYEPKNPPAVAETTPTKILLPNFLAMFMNSGLRNLKLCAGGGI